jgi:hypothetical protein
MPTVLVNWHVARALAAARVALGTSVDPELLERALRDAVLELVDGGVTVADYLAELAFRRVVDAVSPGDALPAEAAAA